MKCMMSEQSRWLGWPTYTTALITDVRVEIKSFLFERGYNDLLKKMEAMLSWFLQPNISSLRASYRQSQSCSTKIKSSLRKSFSSTYKMSYQTPRNTSWVSIDLYTVILKIGVCDWTQTSPSGWGSAKNVIFPEMIASANSVSHVS